METGLVTNDDTQRLAQTFDDPRRLMAAYEAELREMPLGALKANLAVEYQREAKRYLEAIKNSALHEQTRRLHEAHSYSSKMERRYEQPGESLSRYCSAAISDWEIERRRRIETERRTREEEANRLAAKQRQAEIEHLKEIGRPDDAAAKALAPVIPISVSIDPDAGKPDGASMVEVWVPKRDESGKLVFTDLGAFLTWVAGRPEMHYLVEFKYGKLKKLLSDNRGMVQPPGLEIERKFEPRTRMEQSDD
jgi:hypothetical protein